MLAKVRGVPVELSTLTTATAPTPKSLWTKVAQLLGDEQTRLQKEALAIQPSKNDRPGPTPRRGVGPTP